MSPDEVGHALRDVRPARRRKQMLHIGVCTCGWESPAMEVASLAAAHVDEHARTAE